MKKTLKDILSDYEIYIPVIQRDYAQGRESQKVTVVRENLVKDIYEVLESDSEVIDFNFVYGTVNVEKDGKKIFYPVDGQQRLTTLYLLHWYLACQSEGLLEEFKKLHAFSYRTRNSAATFFSLIKHSEKAVVEIIRSTNGDMKKRIEDQPWFQAEWRFDPTIKSALNMLEEFRKKKGFKDNAEKFYKRLTDEKAIFFTMIAEEPAKEKNTAEKSAAKNYIRMNARGKTLEDFENLKAMLDRIEEKAVAECGINFIEKYDTTYINYFYNRVIKYNNLELVTKQINDRSYKYIKNIHNLACDVFLLSHKCSELTFKYSDDYSFMKKIYSLSQKNFNDYEKQFIKMYFYMLSAVLEYETDKEDSEELRINEGFDEISNIAKILYIYYTAEKKKKISKQHIELLMYVLDNLKYKDWSSRDDLKYLNDFIKAVTEYSDVFEFFREMSLEKLKGLMIKCSTKGKLNDILVRLKEQKIKCQIIKDNNLNLYFFRDLEETLVQYPLEFWKSVLEQRKLQALLYITNYWNNYKEGCIETLIKYMEFAKIYFKKDDKDRLQWRQAYAVAVNLNAEGVLKPEKDINEGCGNKHIWEDGNLFWTDSDEENVEKVAEQMEYFQITFENMNGIEQIIKDIQDKKYVEFKECWLTHAIYGNKAVYLKERLVYRDNNVYVIGEIDKKSYCYRFDLFYLEKAMEFEHGLGERRLQDLIKRSVKSRWWGDSKVYTCKFCLNVPSDVNEKVKERAGVKEERQEIFAHKYEKENSEEYKVLVLCGKYRYKSYSLNLSKHKSEQKVLAEKYKKIIEEYTDNKLRDLLNGDFLTIVPDTNTGEEWIRYYNTFSFTTNRVEYNDGIIESKEYFF